MEIIETSLEVDKKIQIVEELCDILDELGWNYYRNQYRIKAVFEPCESSPTGNNTLLLIDVFDDKLFFSATSHIKTNYDTEVIKLLNYLNCDLLYYGRYILTESGEIWYDYSIDTTLFELNENIIYRSACLIDKCVNRFENQIYNVAKGYADASTEIEKIKQN